MDPGFRFGLAILDGAIDYEQAAAALQRAAAFAHESFRRAEMMRRDPATHEIECLIRKGKLFCWMHPRFQSQPAFPRGFHCPVEHRLGDVTDGNLMTQA